MFAERAKRGAGALTVALCFFVAIIEGFDIQAMGVAAPRLAPDLGLSPDQMGWVFSMANVGIVTGAAFGGWIADRVGRKPVLIGAVVVFGAFSLATIAAHDFATLFAVRLCAGLGFGAALPNIMAIAVDVSAPDKRALTAAAMFCGMPIGGGFSALLTQALASDYDWRILFLCGGVLPLLIAPLLAVLMRETGARGATHKGMTTFAALFGENRAAPTLLLWIAFFPTLLVLYLILNWLPTLVVSKGLERAVAPQASLAFNFAGAAGAIVVGYAVDHFKSRWPLVLGYAGLIAALVALANANGLSSVVALSGAAGFFLLGANFALYGVAASYYPIAGRGTGSGASVAVGRVGSIAGPLLAGLLLSVGASAQDVITIMVPAALIAGCAAAALTLFAPRRD